MRHKIRLWFNKKTTTIREHINNLKSAIRVKKAFFKKWLRGEYQIPMSVPATGILFILTVGILILVINIVIKVLGPVVDIFTQNVFLQVAISIGIILLLGVIIRKLKSNKKTAWMVDLLPSRSMEKPEMIWETTDGYASGILLRYETIPGDIVRYAVVSKVNAGPTSITLLSPEFIPVNRTKLTGRLLKDVTKELVTLGAVGTNGEKSIEDAGVS
ncbi:MAG: hypothetical protein M1320_02090 [Patescibacteria group bacterium]|nr:hypothetical protein [Patescibacteria group bacterium]